MNFTIQDSIWLTCTDGTWDYGDGKRTNRCLLVDGDVATIKTKGDVIRALYDLHQRVEFFDDGDVITLDGVVIAKVTGVHVMEHSTMNDIEVMRRLWSGADIKKFQYACYGIGMDVCPDAYINEKFRTWYKNPLDLWCQLDLRNQSRFVARAKEALGI